MSYIRSSIFLPDYVLESVVDERTPRIDPETFLSKATPAKLLEVILAFYPHFKFTKSAQEDHELLRMIFLEMVAYRLRNLAIPSQPDKKFINAPLIIQDFGPEEDPILVDSAADLELDRERKSIFNIYCLPYLKNGEYQCAADGLETFCKTYKFLNRNELNSVQGTQDAAQDHLHDCLSNLTETHKEIESLHLQLSHGIFGKPSTSAQDKSVYDRLKSALTTLRSRQILFNSTLQDVALLSALGDLHEDLLIKNQQTPSPSASEAEDSEKGNQSTAPQDPPFESNQ